MNEPTRIVTEMVSSIERRGLTVGSAVLFGSAVRNDSADDIDCVVLVDDHRREFVPDLNIVRRRMEGDYSSPAPRDPAYEPERVDFEEIARRHGYAFWDGFGSIDRNVPARRVHMQGPCAPQAWRVYADEFPIVAWSIRLNGPLLAGKPLYAGAVTAASVDAFVASMRTRLGSDCSLSYTRKCVQALQVALGGQATEWAAARDGAIEAGVFTRTELPALLELTDLSWVARRALDALESMAAMRSESADSTVLRAASVEE